MAVLQEIQVPLLAVNDTTLTVTELNFNTGDQVKNGDAIMSFETSKTTYDVIAEADGYVQYNCIKGNDYAVNEVVALILSDASEVKSVQPQKAAAFSSNGVHKTAAVASGWSGDAIFSAAAIKLMQEKNVASTAFAGRDFVRKEDVEALLGIAKPKAAATKSAPAKKPLALVPTDIEKVVLEKLSSNKKREIDFLSQVQSAGLTSTIHTMISTKGVFETINPALKYLKNSLLPVIIYEVSRLLKKYPLLNAYYADDSIALYKNVGVGFAIDIDKGLKVAKVAGAGEKRLQEIEEEILALSGKYLDDKLQIEDLTDITFTITDLSAESVSLFKPLVNAMNSAILGVSAIDEQLQRCTLTITFDHRITEGKTVALFLKELKERMETYTSANTKNVTCFKCYKSLAEDLGDAGFVKCVTPAGADAYICQSCFKGF